MALPATAVIECRASATAGNVNGGGFNSARGGTDYTLQDAAQLTNTDGAASGTTTFTSAGGGFTSQMVGNYLHITASTGLTVGWYEIVTFTDTNNVVLDRTPGTGSASTFYVGGAMSLNSTLDDELFEILIAGNIMYVKAGSYSIGEAVSITTPAPTATTNIFVLGYNATRGDNPTGSNRPTIAFGANAFSFSTGHIQLKNIIFTGTDSAVIGLYSTDYLVTNCKVLNSSTTASRIAIQYNNSNSRTFNCEIIAQNGVGISAATGGGHRIESCYIHNCTTGASIGDGTMRFNIFENCKTAGITTSTTTPRFLIASNTFYGAETTPIGIGFQTTGATGTGNTILNNIFYGLSTGIQIGTAAADSNFEDYNCFNNNTTDRTRISTGANSVTTNPSFTSVSQITGTNGTTSGSVLTSSGADFSTVTDNVDWVRIVSGTGVTAMNYLITSHTSDTLTLNVAPGTNATADKVFVIYKGHNFLPTGNI